MSVFTEVNHIPTRRLKQPMLTDHYSWGNGKELNIHVIWLHFPATVHQSGKEGKAVLPRTLMQSRNKRTTKGQRSKITSAIYSQSNMFSIECLGTVSYSCPPVYEPRQVPGWSSPLVTQTPCHLAPPPPLSLLLQGFFNVLQSRTFFTDVVGWVSFYHEKKIMGMGVVGSQFLLAPRLFQKSLPAAVHSQILPCSAVLQEKLGL